MDPVLTKLLANKSMWSKPLARLLAKASTSSLGLKAKDALSERFPWSRDPMLERAFYEAFRAGTEKYLETHYASRAANSAVRMLYACVRDETSALNLSAVLDVIFGDILDVETVRHVARTTAVDFGDAVIPLDEATSALISLIQDYLRPAFRAHAYFTNAVGFSEVVNLLREIRAALPAEADSEALRLEYLEKMGEKLDVIPLQGISPKVQNRTIGMKMEDVFIPLGLRPDRDNWARVLQGHWPVWLAESKVIDDVAISETLHKWAAISDLHAKPPVPLTIGSLSIANSPKITVDDLDTWISLYSPARPLKIMETEASSVTIEAVLELSRAVVRGDPGSGKSTLARFVAWAVARGRREIGKSGEGLLPVLMRASDFGEALETGRAASLESYLLHASDRFAPAVSKDLSRGRVILLIDGLDEINKPTLRSQVKERIEDFLSDPVFKRNRLIITTRIVGYERTGAIGRFAHFTIEELTDEQIRDYITHWYRAIYCEMPGAINVKAETDQLVKAITANRSILKMARNPLLLTIVALIKWQGRALPDSRVLLYDAATQTLIRSWPLAQRGVEFDELFIREWLAPLAHHILADRTGDLIDEGALMDELVASMRRLKSVTEIEAKSASRKLLDDICEQSGFLLAKGTDADGRNLYGFLHQTSLNIWQPITLPADGKTGT